MLSNTSISRNQFWALRQNYGEKTNQKEMRDFILKTSKVTCPWGGDGEHREKVANGTFNEKPVNGSKRTSRGQDRTFVQKMNVGDIVLIPFKGIKTCILARITGDVDYEFDSGMFMRESNGERRIDVVGDKPFRPIVRNIEILNASFPKPPRLARQTVTTLRKDIVLNV